MQIAAEYPTMSESSHSSDVSSSRHLHNGVDENDNGSMSPSIKDEISVKEELRIDHHSIAMAMKDPNNPSRRPPRKSTLTQQQKNNKRQRATQDQLGTLEIEFNKNPTPTAAVRERIAQEIEMTERSVQIWFQNRRAKIKNLAKKSIETGEDCDAIPESMRRYLAMQAYESGKPLQQMMPNGTYAPYPNGLIMNTDNSNSKVLISHLACRSLEIGSWRRVAQTSLDLVVFYSPEVSKITYYINAESSGFKIEYPFSCIKNITMDNGDPSSNAEGASQRTGGLIVELNRPPTFSMDQCQGGWFQCGDFTENRQASLVLTHYLGGHPKVLSNQLAKLISLDAFRNRQRAVPDQAAMLSVPVAVPISPIGPMRPASQPNHLVHPHAQPFHQESPNPSAMPPPAAPPRGHKRQRSQSVPAALDFSQLRQPPYAFHPQHHQEPAPHFIHHHHHTFAPIPQRSFSTVPQHLDLVSPNTPGLDTSGISFAFHPPPMSATTVDSATDAHFKYGNFPEPPGSAPIVTTPFTNPFLSPLPEAVSHPQSASPMSSLSHNEPLIADQSPFFGDMGRSDSADVFTPYGDSDLGDNNFGFDDMNSKHPFVLPFRAPDMDLAADDFDFQNMINMPGPESMSPEGNTPIDTSNLLNDSESSQSQLQQHHHQQQQQQQHHKSSLTQQPQSPATFATSS